MHEVKTFLSLLLKWVCYEFFENVKKIIQVICTGITEFDTYIWQKHTGNEQRRSNTGDQMLSFLETSNI